MQKKNGSYQRPQIANAGKDVKKRELNKDVEKRELFYLVKQYASSSKNSK